MTSTTVKLLNGDLIVMEGNYGKRDLAMMVAAQYKQDLESVQLTRLEQNMYLAVFKDPRITVSAEVLKNEYAYFEEDDPVYHLCFHQYDTIIVRYKIILREKENGLSFALADSFCDDYYDTPNGEEICYYIESDETQWFSSPIECIALDLHPRLNQDTLDSLADEIMHSLLTTRNSLTENQV